MTGTTMYAHVGFQLGGDLPALRQSPQTSQVSCQRVINHPHSAQTSIDQEQRLTLDFFLIGHHCCRANPLDPTLSVRDAGGDGRKVQAIA